MQLANLFAMMQAQDVNFHATETPEQRLQIALGLPTAPTPAQAAFSAQTDQIFSGSSSVQNTPWPTGAALASPFQEQMLALGLADVLDGLAQVWSDMAGPNANTPPIPATPTNPGSPVGVPGLTNPVNPDSPALYPGLTITYAANGQPIGASDPNGVPSAILNEVINAASETGAPSANSVYTPPPAAAYTSYTGANGDVYVGSPGTSATVGGGTAAPVLPLTINPSDSPNTQAVKGSYNALLSGLQSLPMGESTQNNPIQPIPAGIPSNGPTTQTVQYNKTVDANGNTVVTATAGASPFGITNTMTLSPDGDLVSTTINNFPPGQTTQSYTPAAGGSVTYNMQQTSGPPPGFLPQTLQIDADGNVTQSGAPSLTDAATDVLNAVDANYDLVAGGANAANAMAAFTNQYST